MRIKQRHVRETYVRVTHQKVQDKAVTCQNFQKACSALVVILMLSCFVTF